jgi:tetratricopeptide (TPR) repeat protein
MKIRPIALTAGMLLMLASALIISCSSAPEAPSAPVPNLSEKELKVKYNRGIQHIKMNEYQKAVIEFTDVIGLVADTGYTLSTRREFRLDAHLRRGSAYSSLGKYEAAINDYTKALQYKSDSVSAYYNRGLAYHNWGQYETAVQDFDAALRLGPGADTYLVRGISYHKLDEHQKAINDYTKAIQLDPDADKYSRRGISYHNLDEHQKAINDYTKAIQLDPDYAIAYYNRGVIYDNLGQDSKANVDTDKACSLDSKYC